MECESKTEVILRFPGGGVEVVSREIQVPVHEMETWRKDFLECGQASLKKRSGDPTERGVKQTQKRKSGTDDEAGARRDAVGEEGYGDELQMWEK